MDTNNIETIYDVDMVKKIYTNSQLISAHSCSKGNRDMLMRSVSCGCFYCETLFFAQDIKEWVKENDGQYTAICPYCGIDSIIGDDSVKPLNKEFLHEMKKYWFGDK